MALTLKRWMALALAGFFLAPVVVLEEHEPRGWQPSGRDRLSDRNQVSQAHVRRAANQLRILQIRDSVLRVAARRPAADVGIDAAFGVERRATFENLAAQVSARRSAAARIPTSVFIVRDTVSRVRGQVRRGGFAGSITFDYQPPTDSVNRCIVIARVRFGNARYASELGSTITADRLLGPCAYFESFGRPGRAIAAWMDARGWQFAQRGEWSTPPLRWLEGTPDSAFRERIDLQWVMNPVGAACAAGKDESCLRALLDATVPDRWRTSVSHTAGVLTSGMYNPFVHGDGGWLTRDWPLGAREWTLLSDMVRTIGPERFERFWTSDLPPEQAFRAATGESLAEWTREWIEDTYHPQAGGPVLSAGATGFGALLLIAGVGLSIVAARRRQTG
ncbi:MAG: hypothetical protein ACREOK_01210 [Gemmatimonadaceae bacterium]